MKTMKFIGLIILPDPIWIFIPVLVSQPIDFIDIPRGELERNF